MTVTLQLKNGLRVANFSSPHEFRFHTGEVLPACSPERANKLKLKTKEIIIHQNGWMDISLSFDMTEEVMSEIHAMSERLDIDIILVPLPVMTALKNSPDSRAVKVLKKARVCRSADRVKKTIYSDRFCV